MSYDISFRVKVDGTGRWIDAYPCDANVTWNIRKMIEKTTGLPWMNEADNGLCTEVIPHIRKGLDKLERNEDRYIRYNAPNGWGTTTGCKRFFSDILRAWECFECDDPELASVAHFFID